MEVHSEQWCSQRWRIRYVLHHIIENDLLRFRAALLVKPQLEISMNTTQQTQEQAYHEHKPLCVHTPHCS